jgi:steroid 5-alpha reductase family enzyme
MIFSALLFHIHLWFLLSLIKNRNDIADIGWGIGFVLLAVTQFILSYQQYLLFDLRSCLVLILVTAWGLRLSLYLSIRTGNKTEDERYVEMKNNWGANWRLQSYLKVYWLQGMLLLIICMPVLILLRAPLFTSLSMVDLISGSVALLGLTIETISDIQKYRFKAKPENNGKKMRTGLWSRSRHPNYLGEILFWVGITLFTIQGPWYFYWSWLSPVLLILLLYHVSGVPLLEKKYEGDIEFETYKSNTGAIFPKIF